MKKTTKTITMTALTAAMLCGTVAPASAVENTSTFATTTTASVIGWGNWGGWSNWWGGSKEVSVENYDARHTTHGMILDATVKNYDDRLTLRASSKPLTGQTGWYMTGYTNSKDHIGLQLTKFDNTGKRYWQLETKTGKVIASGEVAAAAPAPKPTPVEPKPTTPAPSPKPTTPDKPTPTPTPTKPAPAPTTPTTPKPTPAPTTDPNAPKPVEKSGFITGYAIHDNDPYGSKGIAYSKDWNKNTIHSEAGGTGTYDDPITIAAPKDTYAPGTRIYLPHVKRYGMVEDLCATSWTATSGCTSVLDLWVGGEMSDSADDTRKCNEKITGTYKFIVNPQRGLPVTEGALFNSKTDTCTAVS